VTLSVSPERPVPQSLVAVLRLADEAARAEGVPCVVGGGIAQGLLLFHVFGEPTPRRTCGIELMVRAAEWTAFERVRDRLLASGAFAPEPGGRRRLLSVDGQVPLELVPSDIAAPPAGGRAGVATAGLAVRHAAVAAAVSLAIADGLSVPVVPLAPLSLLAMAAWLERRHETDDDAGDLLLLLRRYGAAGNEERLYAEETELFRSCGFDPELAGGRLLARDAARLCGPAPVRAVLDRMSVAHWRDLSERALRQAADLEEDASESRVRDLVVAYWDELSSAAAGA
jgi:predicted nucleotidyltransferase